MTTTYATTVDSAVDDSGQNPPTAPAVAAGNPHSSPPTRAATDKTSHSRGGAPLGNANRTSHGLKGSKLPPGCKVEAGHVQRLVRAVRAEYEAKHGAMTTHAESILHRIRRAAVKDRLAARWLRLEASLTIEQRMALTDAMSAAAETIEKCLRLLKLDTDATTADPMAALRELVADAAPDAAEKPGRFSGGSKPLESSEAAGTPQRANGKASNDITETAAP